MFLRRPANEIIAGSVFRRVPESPVTETAQVVSVKSDRMGIPHVRYRLWMDQPSDDGTPADERTLALSAFRELYPEPA